MKIKLKVSNALYDAKHKRLVLHGKARKEGFFEKGYGDFRLDLTGDDIAKLAAARGLSDSLTSVQIMRSLMDTDLDIQIED